MERRETKVINKLIKTERQTKIYLNVKRKREKYLYSIKIQETIVEKDKEMYRYVQKTNRERYKYYLYRRLIEKDWYVQQ